MACKPSNSRDCNMPWLVFIITFYLSFYYATESQIGPNFRRLYKWIQMVGASVVLNRLISDNGRFYSLFKESNYTEEVFSFIQITYRLKFNFIQPSMWAEYWKRVLVISTKHFQWISNVLWLFLIRPWNNVENSGNRQLSSWRFWTNISQCIISSSTSL